MLLFRLTAIIIPSTDRQRLNNALSRGWATLRALGAPFALNTHLPLQLRIASPFGSAQVGQYERQRGP